MLACLEYVTEAGTSKSDDWSAGWPADQARTDAWRDGQVGDILRVQSVFYHRQPPHLSLVKGVGNALCIMTIVQRTKKYSF